MAWFGVVYTLKFGKRFEPNLSGIVLLVEIDLPDLFQTTPTLQGHRPIQRGLNTAFTLPLN
jgi:hypothetical protein